MTIGYSPGGYGLPELDGGGADPLAITGSQSIAGSRCAVAAPISE